MKTHTLQTIVCTLALTAFTGVTGLYAEDKKDDTKTDKSAMKEDMKMHEGVCMMGGKMMHMDAKGHCMVMEKDMKMEDGTVCMKNGECKMKDGTKRTLKEGEMMHKDGKVMMMNDAQKNDVMKAAKQQ